MAKTIRAKAKAKDGLVDVKVLMKHPMETGLRKDKEGNKIPPHFIQNVMATVSGQTVFSAEFNTSVSKDPYLAFSYPGQSGDALVIAWMDNQGNSDNAEFLVK